jgi:hypothetical protein
VRVTALGTYRRKMDGIAVDLSGRGLRILLPDPVDPGDALKVELADTLLLGEVCYCSPQDYGFIVGLQIDQVLSGLADLARLNRALFDGTAARVILPISEQA